MKNAGMAGAVALVGIGLITIGLSNFQGTPQAQAAPVVAVNQGPEEPTIVWYGTIASASNASCATYNVVLRAWSDGTIEGKYVVAECNNCVFMYGCDNWFVIASPTDGMNAAADINFDEIVDGADLAMLLGKWGTAPRNPMPPSDCPLGLLNPS